MAYTEKITVQLAAMARKDAKARVGIYSKINTGSMLWQRLNKEIPMPQPVLAGDTRALRMIYTAVRFWMAVHRDM